MIPKRKLTTEEQATAIKLILKKGIPDNRGAMKAGLSVEKYRKIINGKLGVDDVQMSILFNALKNYE